MYISALAFLSGITSTLAFKTLPSLFWFFLGISLVSILWHFLPHSLKFIAQWLLFAFIGCAFAIFRAQQILSWKLPANLENKTITVTGTIASLPQIKSDQAGFEFKLKEAKIRLSWYQFNPNEPLHVGDVWQLQVRLKKPHGLANPGTFDYERWLFSRKIRATGYVVNHGNNHKITNNTWHYPIDRFREILHEKIQHELQGQPSSGLITALIMGAQDNITNDQWRIMRATGTNHLMAIAGVHIGFVSGFFYLLVNFFWRRIKNLSLFIPAMQASSFAALLVAILYSALAGFSLPTQRALIMLTVCLSGIFLRRHLSLWNGIALALLIVLILDPFSILTVSFWLSFGAVFAILYGISYRFEPKGIWWKYGRVQWVITLGLIPISLCLFQQTSLIALIANLIAVPAVGILVLPVCLTGAVMLFISQPLAHFSLIGSAKIISQIWLLLGWLSTFKWAVWQQPMPNDWILITSIIGILIILLPKGLPGRWLGLCWIFPLIYWKPPAPHYGEVWFTLLDVGQGLAAIVRTQNHTLVFDTGPKMGEFDDAGQRVILPFLHYSGISHIDTLMVSHGDNDHIGGAYSLIQNIPITQILTSVPEKFQSNHHLQFMTQLCQAGQSWHWDGIIFTLLYPSSAFLHLGNNSSCVLKIGQEKNAILLTGDIEKNAEEELLKTRNLLPAQIIVAPHHGSVTSSTADFVSAVNPRYVLFPIGYKNKFHFPNQIVVKRYLDIGAKPSDTAKSGAISLHIDAKGSVVGFEEYRKIMFKFWN